MIAQRTVDALVRLAAVVALIVGLGVGAATLVKWTTSDTAVEALNAVAPWGGLAFFIATTAVYAIGHVRDPESGRIVPAVVLAVGGVALLLTGGIEAFRPFGIVALIMLPISGAISYRNYLSE